MIASHSAKTAPLLFLTPAQLALVAGERRQKLLGYLLRWEHVDEALGYLDSWLMQQPTLATLREMRVRALLASDNPASALELLDGLDAERGMTETRRGLRVRALKQQKAFAAALDLLPSPSHDTVTGWRLRAEVLCAAGRFAEARSALEQAAVLMAEGSAPTRALAELALAEGDAQRARELIEEKTRRSGSAPDVEDLRQLLLAAQAIDDHATEEEISERLAHYEAVEAETLHELLGLDRIEATHEPAAPAPALRQAAPAPQLPPEALIALQEHFGLQSFRPGQEQVISRALAGRSTLGVMPTGSGKSLTYQLPALLLPGATVVISPLIALMKDQLDNLPPAIREKATAINSSLPPGELQNRLRGVAEGRYKLVYVAPERLRQRPFVEALRSIGLSLFVVDEAHCVSLWGVSFRPDYLFIRQVLAELDQPPVLALTATATPDTQAEIIEQLGDLEVVSTSVFRPNLRFEVYTAANQNDKLQAVVELCRSIEGAVIVYARSRSSCEEIAYALRRAGVAAAHYHAQIDDRADVQERFMSGEIRVLAATVAFGMGVDKSDVRAIIHYNLPQSVEGYYQEAGRAGRDGQSARCILLYTSSDKSQLTSWLRQDTLTRDNLRDVYRSLKRRTANGWGIITLGEIQHALGDSDETRLRVALGLMERIGLLVRHYDLPRTITLTLRVPHADDPLFCAGVRASALPVNQSVAVDPLDFAAQLGCRPADLESVLLDWHRKGWLRYEGSARDVLIELLPAPADSGDRIDRLLEDYSQRQNARIDAIATYARSLGCRHTSLANHFGEQLAACVSSCDVCLERQNRHTNGTSVSTRPTALGATEAILAAVQELSGQLSEKELAFTLLGKPGYPAGNSFGALAGSDAQSIRQQIARLVATNKLAYQNGALVVPTFKARPARSENAGLLTLRCLQHMPFAVGRSGLARVLKASASSPIQADRCPEYGALHDLTIDRIEGLIEQLVEAGFVERDESNNYRLLSLTALGHDALADESLLPAWAELSPASSERVATSRTNKTTSETPADIDRDLLENLTQWRKQKATEINLPPFYIFSNATLNLIATTRPTTLDALGRVKGIGAQKLALYGDDVLALVNERVSVVDADQAHRADHHPVD